VVGPRGFTTAVEHPDLAVDGRYWFAMTPPGGEPFHLHGRFVGIERPGQLAFTFVWEPPEQDDRETVVRLHLAGRTSGTELSLSRGSLPPRNAGRCTATAGPFDKLRETLGPSS
jgi:uncharacterized protein YndB with AHSA1/START domain